MITQAEKKELVDWLNDLEDPELVRTIKSIKDSQIETDWWDEIPEAAKESIRRGEKDIKTGRVYSSEEFWENIQKWREKNNI